MRTQGYASLRDLLAHVGVWWEEARGIIAEAVKHGDRPARKYNFAEFNAASVQRFTDTAEADFLRWFEAERQRMIAVVANLTDEELKVRRIHGWLDGVILEHLKEHGFDAPRFLIIDMLEREWAAYIPDFNALAAAERAGFLEKQGFERFRDVLAHIIAWWEHGIRTIEAAGAGKVPVEEDVDAFNAQAVERFRPLAEAQLLAAYEKSRLTLVSLMDMLPDEVLSAPNVQSWLRADVIEHYYEHSI